MRHSTVMAAIAIALVLPIAGCRPSAPSFTVTGLAGGQKVALYDALTGSRLSVSRAAGRDGIVTVPLASAVQSHVFALGTRTDGVSGSGVASREMTVSAGQVFSYAAWRDAPRSGTVELYFDDGAWTVWRYGREMFREFGVQVRIPVVTTSAFETSAGTEASDVMSWTQIGQMAADGHVVVSHTRTHPHLTAIDDERLASELAGSLQDLRAHSIDATELVYPFGDRDARVIAAAKGSYLRARGSIGYNDPAKTDMYDVATQDSAAGVAAVGGFVDHAVTNGLWLTIMYHGVRAERQDPGTLAWVQSSNEVHPAVLRAELAHIVSSGIAYPVLMPRAR